MCSFVEEIIFQVGKEINDYPESNESMVVSPLA
jgi:hypothetical protein